MADAETSRLWVAYLQAEKDHVKETRTAALDQLVDWVERLPVEIRAAWSFELLRQVVDEKKDIPVRFPLFRRVLLPVLIEGILSKQPGCARWLANFQSLLIHSEKEASNLPESLRNPVELLQEALRVDPSDDRARQMLISHHATYLDYTLHELPSGVLYGANGATVDECGELIELLEEFRSHLAKVGRVGEFEELLKECAYHYEAYRTYLRSGRPGGSYEAFLEANPGPK